MSAHYEPGHTPHKSFFSRKLASVKEAFQADLGADDLPQMANMAAGHIPAIPLVGAVVAAPFVLAGAIGAGQELVEQVRVTHPKAVADHRLQNERIRRLGIEHADLPVSEQLAVEQVIGNRLGHEVTDSRIAIGEKVLITGGTSTLFGGVVASAVAGTLKVAAMATAAPAVAAAGAVVSTVATAAFIPAQAAILVASLVQAGSGVRSNARLKGDARAIASNAALIEPHTAETLQQGLAQRRKYNRIGKQIGGTMVATGQGLMIAGAVTTLTIALAPLGIALAGSGVAASVTGTGLRLGAGKKTHKAAGGDASELARQRANDNDLGTLVNERGIDAAIARTAGFYASDQKAIAEAKLFSLISHDLDREDALNARRRPGTAVVPRSADERRSAVGSMVSSGKKGRFTGTTLLRNDLLAMQNLYATPEFDTRFFAGSTKDVRTRINQMILQHPAMLEVDATETMQERLMSGAAERLDRSKNEQIKAFLAVPRRSDALVIEQDAWTELKAMHPEVDDAYAATFSKDMSRQMKSDAKFMRMRAMRELATLSRANVQWQAASVQSSRDAHLSARPLSRPSMGSDSASIRTLEHDEAGSWM